MSTEAIQIGINHRIYDDVMINDTGITNVQIPSVVTNVATSHSNNLMRISGNMPVEDVHCHVARSPPNRKARNQLIVVSIICICFMGIEIAGGLISGSLALLTDATHLASDITSFVVGLIAIWLANKPSTARMSFGYHRAEILGALTSVLIIWIITAILCYFAVRRIITGDYDIGANEMLITASAGVVFNIIMGAVLHFGLCCKCDIPHGHSHGGHGHSHGPSSGHSHSNEAADPNTYIPNGQELSYSIDDSFQHSDQEQIIPDDPEAVKHHKNVNINVRAAFIHVVGDFVQSIGVLIAAIIIKCNPDYKIADPICTFVFSVLVIITTISVLRDVLMVIMESVPRNIDYKIMKRHLETLDGVCKTHSLHVWSLTTDKVIMTVHLAIKQDADWDLTVKRANKLLRESYGAFESVVQVESYQENIMEKCEQCIGP